MTAPSLSVPTPLLNFDQLTVQRGEIPLCEGVSLHLSASSICHLIGANGTGKTTLLMQLAGLLPIITGAIYYKGMVGIPVQPLYVSHQLGIHPSLTVAQNLTFCSICMVLRQAALISMKRSLG